MNPTTPRTPDEAYESILRTLFKAIAEAQPRCLADDPLAMLWCMFLRAIIRLVAGFGRVSAAAPRKAVAPAALPQGFASPCRLMPEASLHGVPQPETPAPAASAQQAGHILRRQMPQAEPTVSGEPTVAAEPSPVPPCLAPSGTWPEPDHASPLAATYVDSPGPVSKNRFGRARFLRAQFVTMSQ